MITITVASYNGAQLAQPLAGHFDEMGGNIGRADNNQLVLPDPERTISRVHAQVVFRGGRYAIVDRGSNPISVNGRPLGNGQEAMLQPGDEISIGGYTMRVEAAHAGPGAAAVDPFADFAGLASAGSGALPGRASAPPAAGYVDPLAGFGMAPSAPPAFAPIASAPSSAAGGIPADWDPFAPDPVAKPRPEDFARSLGQAGAGGNFGLDIGGRAAPLIPDMPASGSGGGDSLDNLFGLSAASGNDPFAGSVLNQAAAQPNMAAHADPMKSLNSMTRCTPQAAADTLSELQSPFMLPPMAAAAPARPAPLPARPSVVPPMAAVPAKSPKGAVLSWDEPSGESRTIIRPRAAAAASQAALPGDLPDL
ncbi:MAG TPA: FHA domain-containing protein, partial [Caldimonas sp.]